MKTAANSDHIWDMLKRQSTVQLTIRQRRRMTLRRRLAFFGTRRNER